MVLAGGASKRMGTDKAFVEVDGRPMIVRVADALWEGGCKRVVCQGGAPELATTLGLEVLADSTPGAGPVSAILAALQHVGGPIVVAACDLADLDGHAVRDVIAVGSGSAAPLVAVAAADGRSHLLSFWSASALEPLRVVVADGVSAYLEALDALGAVAAPVDPAAVRNINRPEDLG